MDSKQLIVGDKLRFYGKELSIVELRDGLVVCEDLTTKLRRAQAQERILALRERLIGADADAFVQTILSLTPLLSLASAAVFKFSLRRDLLEWFPELGFWFSPGRLMSDEEKEKARKLEAFALLTDITGDKEREAVLALTALESKDGNIQ